jgi:hypothetical protein
VTENPNVNSTDEQAKVKDAFGEFVDHETKAVEASVKALEALLPEGFKENAKVAGKEFAAGLKVLVDAAIEAIDKASKDIDEKMKAQRGTTVSAVDAEHPSTTGPAKVKVQVE